MENFQFLKDKDHVANADLQTVYKGIKKLVVVHVCLTRGQDDPQMIFESLNSTGLDLTPADLIRNFVLMRLDEQTQTRLYEDYWQPIETAFGTRYRTEFDTFVRDYLTIRGRASTPIRSEAIYREFCTYFTRATKTDTVENILADLKRFGTYYTALSFGNEKEPNLKTAFDRLHTLIEVAAPVILTLYDCYDRAKTLTLQEFIQAVELLESYVFRRSVCDLQTRSLNQIFASLANRIQEQTPLTSLQVALYRQSKKRRFPVDNEFREALETRDVYDMRNCFYLLDRLENFSKERIDTSTFTIEHVMPQNEELRPEWRTMLGPDWKQVKETWLHRLGNVTLTGYNTPYSDRPFNEKKTMQGGFNQSPLRLNKFIREQLTWTAAEIQERGTQLANKAISVWPPLAVDLQAVKEAELKERIAQAAQYKLDDLTMDAVARQLFTTLQPQLQALGGDVVELCTAASITYRVYDFFVEVIPRKHRLTLLINLAFEDCNDPSGKARNATEAAFVINATETGGVLCTIKDDADIPAAINIARQAYESIAE
jgi:predicted transport protein